MSALGHPDWLPVLLGAWLAVAAALLFARWRAARRLALLLGSHARLAGRGDAWLLLALLAVVVALLGPRLGTRTLRVPATGVDCVVLLDVSRSMDARDVPPSRLDRATQAAHALLAGLGAGDRSALAAFAARGVLLTPLTSDHAALQAMLPDFDTELLSAQGSDLAAGIRAAGAAFDPASPRPRVLVVLSDGENPAAGEEAVADAVDAATALAVRVVAAGFGSESGAEVPTALGPLRDAFGKPVRSRRQDRALDALAAATGGRRLATDAWGALDLRELVAQARLDATSAPEGFVEREVPAVWSAPFAALALALLLLEAGALTPLRLRRLAPLAVGALAATLLGAGRGEIPAPRTRPAAPSPEALLSLGVARAESGDLEEAERAFLSAALRARDPRLAAAAYYDLGVAALLGGRLPDAQDAFFDALALAPDDREARFNLEWTLRRLESQAPQPDARGDGPPEDEAEGEAASEADEPGEEERETRPGDDPEGEPQEAGRQAARSVPELSEEEATRWLELLRDDTKRALRAAAREARSRERRSGPAW